MIKNIPNKYTQKMILEEIDKDFKNLYDFFYLPIDFDVPQSPSFLPLEQVQCRVRLYQPDWPSTCKALHESLPPNQMAEVQQRQGTKKMK